MVKELVKEKWSNAINSITIGATKDSGGTRESIVKVGGETTLPFIFSDGDMPNNPVVAFEIFDTQPQDYPQELTNEYKDVYGNAVDWAQMVVEKHGAKLICLTLAGAHPEQGDISPEKEAQLVKDILSKVKVPLIIIGCGDDTKDNLVLPACAQAAKGEKCLFGSTVQENYKTLTAACLADGHDIIAESPIDINIAKQLNILISEMGFPLDRIVINPTVGALGYGLEYAYSIMERARLAALSGDKMLAQPFICFVGRESWRAKEAKARVEEFPQWGKQPERSIAWETLTAGTFLQAGADILVMRHPKAIKNINEHIDKLMER